MKAFCLAIVALAGCLCSGCASGLIGTLPAVGDRENASEIIILRGYVYVSSKVSAYVSFDNNDVLAIRAGQYTRFLAPPGNHTLGVRNPGFPSSTIPVTLAPKEKYYFGVSVGFSNFHLVPATEEQARPYMEQDTYVPLDNTLK